MADLETLEAPAANEAALNFQTETTGTRDSQTPPELSRGADPVQIYLNEIGSTPLSSPAKDALATRISSAAVKSGVCLLYTSPSPRDLYRSRMPSSA